MANKTLFSSQKTEMTVNNAGGKAYLMSARHKLAQIACTNCFNGTFYASSEDNLELAKKAVMDLRQDPKFVAKVAIYSRDKTYMKDMPAFLTCVLACWGEHELFHQVFDRVIDNGKMLRNFMQIGRSGQAGKVINMSSGAVRKAVNRWFKNRSPEYIFRASVGNDPSMRDMLRMGRPKPESEVKATLYAYLKGAVYDDQSGTYKVFNKDGSVLYQHRWDSLPEIVKHYELFKLTHEGEIPNVDFRMLDSFLTKEEMKKIWHNQAMNGPYQMVRMNINNMIKYGVFEDSKAADRVAKLISSKEEIIRAKLFPYQLMTSYMMTTDAPLKIREAMQDAMEVSIENVPEIDGNVYICVDVSYSMSSPITGASMSSSVVRCVDVAGLFASSILRRNKQARLLPFAADVKNVTLNPRDTVMTNAKILSDLLGGGTNCSRPLAKLNEEGVIGNTVIFVSDNESWMDTQATWNSGNQKTETQKQWDLFKVRNPKAKLICIDLTPRDNAQVKERKDILQVGGFSDNCWSVISSFLTDNSKDHWVSIIESVEV